MRFVLQCVSQASCTVEGRVTGAIERGYLILVGIADSDTEETADRMLKKVAGLRIFPDENGKTNLSLAEIGGSILLISQFTLYADCRKGNRPSFVKAASPNTRSGSTAISLRAAAGKASARRWKKAYSART